MKRCRHYDSWLIAGGNYEWCYRCGALRRMRETGIAACTPDSEWCRPVGSTAENPWEAWHKRSERMRQRRLIKPVALVA